eukprot:1101006-Pelagomonas_calceolata.AAC.1
MWAEAVATASYARNRSPTSGKTKTPVELFYGIKPDVLLWSYSIRAHLEDAAAQAGPSQQEGHPGRLRTWQQGLPHPDEGHQEDRDQQRCHV